MLGLLNLNIRQEPAIEAAEKKIASVRCPGSKRGQQTSGNSNSQKITTSRGGKPEPRKGKGGDMKHPRKEFAICGCAHSG